MAFIINENKFRKDMAELEAYRATKLTPKEVCSLMVTPAPAPAPLDLNAGDMEDSFSVAAGILDDDDLAEVTQLSLNEAQWNK